MGARRLGVAVSVLVVVVACSALLSAGAYARVEYARVASFSPPETGFEGGADGVAVDNSAGSSKGDVYVSDPGNEKVYEFSAAGKLLGQSSMSGAGVGRLAVADGGAFAGYIYVIGGHGVLFRFAPGLTGREEVVTGLSGPSDVAVDGAGNVFVAEGSTKKVLEFNSAGLPVDPLGAVVGAGENVVAEPSFEPVELGVGGSGTNLFVSGVIYPVGETIEYTLSAGVYAAVSKPFASLGPTLGGIAVSSFGNVYIGDFSGVYVYSSADEFLAITPGPELFSGVAVNDETGDVYVAWNEVSVFEPGELPSIPTTEPDSGHVGSFVTLNGTLAGGETGYYFEYAVGPSCQGGQRTPLSAAAGAEQVHIELKELNRLSEYSYCLVAVNKYGAESGTSVSFEVGQVQPGLVEEGISSVATHTATLRARINPNDLSGTYYFEYGIGSNYTAKTSQYDFAAGVEPISIAVPLTELESNTGYHFRLVVTNEIGTNTGEDMTFSTYPTAVSGLPDGRVYEMVSPVYNPYDMEVYEVTSGFLPSDKPFLSSPNGDTVVYSGMPSSGGTGGESEDPQQYRATRSPYGGWTQVNVSPPGGGVYEKYSAFSPDLSAAVIPNDTEPPFGTTKALINDNTLNRYNVFYDTSFAEELFRPLFTVVPPNRFLAPSGGGDKFISYYAGASADFTHFFFEANDDLLSEGAGQAEGELATHTKQEGEYGRKLVALEEESAKLRNEGKNQQAQELYPEEKSLELLASHQELYMSVGGHVSLVNIGPSGELIAGASFGDSYTNQGIIINKNADHAVSADGSRVFWSGVNTDPNVVFVRVDGDRTEQVSNGAALYRTASPDGRYAYYTEKGNLWRFDVDSDEREEVAGPEAEVAGVIGVNQTGESGAYVYFVAEGVLTGEEENAEKQKAEMGYDNLYVSETDPANPDQHVTRFIARLESSEKSDWAHLVNERTAEVSPDGRSLVFDASLNLLGRPYGGEGGEEVYDYRVGDGRLFCVSCRPQASGGQLSPNVGLQARRWVSEDDDRVFFDSKAPLVEQDVDGVNDVYEWESDGTGACKEDEGCVYLLSGGVEAAAYFADASENGDDVFMATRQRLVPEDQNEFSDLYDARVDGARPVTPPQCTGTGCQGIPAPPPIFATPSSVTFNGVGNFPSVTPPSIGSKTKSLTSTRKLKRVLAACHRKKRRRRRTMCEKRARKQYGAAAKTGRVR